MGITWSMQAVFATLCLTASMANAMPWLGPAPEQLPPVTVRWEDPAQQKVFAVEGARYSCRVGAYPARLLGLTVDGQHVLENGATFSVTDGRGNRYVPAPPELTPVWNVWRRQWLAASDSRARMNVWNATPYYWDAHLLDIPLIDARMLDSLKDFTPKLLTAWSFKGNAAGWRAANNTRFTMRPDHLEVTLTGTDPYIMSPAVSLKGPIEVRVRMRTRMGGGGALYWATRKDGLQGSHVLTFPVEGDGEWHDYRLRINTQDIVTMIRLDPAGDSGSAQLASVAVYSLPDSGIHPPVIRGEWVFHAHPDHLRVQLRIEPPDGVTGPFTAQWSGLPASAIVTPGDRPLAQLTDRLACLGPRGSSLQSGVWTTPLPSGGMGVTWVLRPLDGAAPMAAAFANDLSPLPHTAVEVENGEWRGYDHTSGLYRMHSTVQIGAFGFEQAYRSPLRRGQTRVRIRGDAQERQMTVVCTTGVGSLEACILTDLNGFPLPVTAFVAKNFDGELEEPDDGAYGDAYFPLHLKSHEHRDFDVVSLMQQYGSHMLKQVSSIRFFNIYWHLSTGVSESTCFTHNWMEIGRSNVLHIPDFRPYSGPFWPWQPQHDCQQWPGFLQYNGATRLMFEKTTFHAVSPNFAMYTNHYRTSDDAATGTLTTWEIPQRDEMRSFVRMRFDWRKPVRIQGDARLNFRWLNIFEFHTPPLLLWTAPDGKTQRINCSTDDKPMLTGQLLSGQTPFAASHQTGGRIACVALVRRFEARLGGKKYSQPALSAQFNDKDGNWWLTVPDRTLVIQPGDWLEAEVMLMPHGEPTLAEMKAERERTERFGMGWPKVTVQHGELKEVFPTRVRAQDGRVDMDLEGGFDMMPLIVEGLTPGGWPLLWMGDVWQNPQAHGGDGVQIEADGNGGIRATLLLQVRKGMKPEYRVTEVTATSPIQAVRDMNGRPGVTLTDEGTMSVQAPVLFGPGVTTIRSGQPVHAFTGVGREFRGLPLTVDTKGTVRVTCDRSGRNVQIVGDACTLTFTDLAWRAAYRVHVDGRTDRQTSGAGTVQVVLPAGQHRVTFEPDMD